MRVPREAEGAEKYLWRGGEIFVVGLISINKGAGGVSRKLITLNFETTIHLASTPASAASQQASQWRAIISEAANAANFKGGVGGGGRSPSA